MRKDADPKYLTIKCPLCEAKKDKPCTYTVSKCYWDWHKQDYIFETRKGDPLKNGRFHQERRDRFRMNELHREWRAQEVVRKKEDKERLDILMAVRTFDREEYEAMRNWIYNHGHILWNYIE